MHLVRRRVEESRLADARITSKNEPPAAPITDSTQERTQAFELTGATEDDAGRGIDGFTVAEPLTTWNAWFGTATCEPL
jgi:hypothetical protein